MTLRRSKIEYFGRNIVLLLDVLSACLELSVYMDLVLRVLVFVFAYQCFLILCVV